MALSELGDGWERRTGGPHSSFVVNKNAGIEARYENERIVAIIFHYLSSDYQPYKGATDRGATAKSTLSDIRSVYGVPSDIAESVHTQFEASPGAREKRVKYSDQGIVFYFVDDELANIRVIRSVKSDRP